VTKKADKPRRDRAVYAWCDATAYDRGLIRVELSRLWTDVNAKRAPDTPSAADADAAPNQLTLALAHHLAAAQAELGLSARALAARSGLSRAYLARVLRGDANVGLGMLMILANAVGKDPWVMIRPPSGSDHTKK